MAKIIRTSAGLRDALFDAIEKLSTGDIDGTQAQAMATIAKQICNTVHLEIEVAKLRTEYPADSPIVVPKPLKLGLEENENQSSKVSQMPPSTRRIADASSKS